MANKPRIPLPYKKDPKGVLELAAKILAKHQTDDTDSVIRGQLQIDLEAEAALIPQALVWHEEAKALERTLEVLYEKRDNVVGRAVSLNQRVCKALQSEYGPQGVRRLGDHGFTVDDSPRPAKSV